MVASGISSISFDFKIGYIVLLIMYKKWILVIVLFSSILLCNYFIVYNISITVTSYPVSLTEYLRIKNQNSDGFLTCGIDHPTHSCAHIVSELKKQALIRKSFYWFFITLLYISSYYLSYQIYLYAKRNKLI